MKHITFLLICLCSLRATAQDTLQPDFSKCRIKGSITIYDYRHKRWMYSDPTDARVPMLPASTFKIINLLIALETGVIRDENAIVKWPGHTDTTLYGYRPDIYHDISVKEAFQVSAGWAFIELAKKIGRKKYQQYLTACRYGNMNLSSKGNDFWNFGNLGIAPAGQINFLVKVYEGKLPFSKRNLDILKKVMITDSTDQYILRSKTGWTRPQGQLEVGWWTGYVERKDNVYFFATRLTKQREDDQPDFGKCRKEVTLEIMRRLKIIE